jgi:translation initiation factor IF-2
VNNENKETSTRSKLTLKLKLPNSSDPKSLALKNAENKRISNSLVQVTIKGRKKDSTTSQPNTQGLNKNEFEARKKALKNLVNKEEFKTDQFDVLSKIRKTENIVEETPIEEVLVKENPKPEESKPIEIEETPKEEVKKNNDYKVDNFDVRNKIKQSVADQNRIAAQREKMLEERKKLEQEKLALEKDKKKPLKKTKNSKFDDEEEIENKRKKAIFDKKEKFNSRRLLQTFIVGDDEGSSYRKKNKNKNKIEVQQNKEYKKIINEVILPELITVSDLAERMAEKTGDVVKKLFTMGMVATSNQVIDADTAELIIAEFGHTTKRVKESDVEDIINTQEEESIEKLDRAPVVTIMGHVDHGKTSLLDAIRSTNVVSGESGGITQHIGASRIKTASGKYITFLDTPGHEAFTEMRSRGANATDIVVLVVAADDGVKEQTVEALNHAKAAGVPIIVAVNKIDKPGADSTRVKNELLQYEVIAEEFSGDTMFVEVSAKEKINLDKLEEAILLQAEILELKAPYQGKSVGVVIETRIDPSKGVIATLLIQKGTLDIGDIIVAGTSFGKIRKMHDDKGKNIKQATPSMPVEILGLNSAPDAGDQFVEVDEEKQARDIISYREKKKRDEKILKNVAKSTGDIFKQAGKSGVKYLPIIIKGDVHGSVEAIVGSLGKIGTEEVAIKVIHSATGGITEGDISLAAVSGAIIIGFNVRANVGAKELAKTKNIDIRYHSIIYNVVDELKLMLGGMLEPVRREEYLGQAEIRQVFKISGSGKIAGCSVIDGVIKKGAKVRLLRDNVVIHDGTLKTLKRFKDDVKEAKSGFECGIALDNFDDIKEKDVIECYEVIEQKRNL